MFGTLFQSAWSTATEKARQAAAKLATGVEAVGEAASRVIVSSRQAIGQAEATAQHAVASGASTLEATAAQWKTEMDRTVADACAEGKKMLSDAAAAAKKAISAVKNAVVSAGLRNRNVASPCAACSTAQLKLLYATGASSLKPSPSGIYGQAEGEAALLSASATSQSGSNRTQIQTSVLDVQGSVEGGATSFGVGYRGQTSATAVQDDASLSTGLDSNNPDAQLTAHLDAGHAEASVDSLVGYDGRRVGFAAEAGASAEAVGASAGGEINIGLGWIPFAPKDWTVSIATDVSGSLGSVGGSAGGQAYYDTEEQRAHFGGQGDLELLGGLGLNLDFSIGKAYQNTDREDTQ